MESNTGGDCSASGEADDTDAVWGNAQFGGVLADVVTAARPSAMDRGITLPMVSPNFCLSAYS